MGRTDQRVDLVFEGAVSTDFQMTPDRVKALIESGHAAVQSFLATWDFDAWVDKYRSGTKLAPPPPQPSTALA
jgi:hypothetical protein